MKTLIIVTILACIAVAAQAGEKHEHKTGYLKKLPIELALGVGIQSDPCDEPCDTGKCDEGTDSQGFLAGRLGVPVASNVKIEGELSRLLVSDWSLQYRVGVWVGF